MTARPRRGTFLLVMGALVVVAAALVWWRAGPAGTPLGVGSRDAGPTSPAPGVGPTSPPGTTGEGGPASGPPRGGVPPLPRCRYGNRPAPGSGYRQWRRTLVDTRFALPPDYVPPGLVPVGEAGFSGPFLVRRVVVEDLSALREAVEAAGHPVEVAAAYRSYDQQAGLFDRRVDQFGREGALRRVARPSHSEHQLGTAVDFKRAGAEDVTQGFGRSGAGRWLAENAWRFGFVLSYPRGESAATCYAYEPWHFRYLGRGLAARVHASGKTVREFLWELHRAGRAG